MELDSRYEYECMSVHTLQNSLCVKAEADFLGPQDKTVSELHFPS